MAVVSAWVDPVTAFLGVFAVVFFFSAFKGLLTYAVMRCVVVVLYLVALGLYPFWVRLPEHPKLQPGSDEYVRVEKMRDVVMAKLAEYELRCAETSKLREEMAKVYRVFSRSEDAGKFNALTLETEEAAKKRIASEIADTLLGKVVSLATDAALHDRKPTPAAAAAAAGGETPAAAAPDYDGADESDQFPQLGEFTTADDVVARADQEYNERMAARAAADARIAAAVAAGHAAIAAKEQNAPDPQGPPPAPALSGSAPALTTPGVGDREGTKGTGTARPMDRKKSRVAMSVTMTNDEGAAEERKKREAQKRKQAAMKKQQQGRNTEMRDLMKSVAPILKTNYARKK
mmetsp:Transcript_12002/g.30285  ORF Transcript_12002/g.30285 Transcript_12002/m.30285 type:complete len:346 (-) Transcript_12002:248-1285(-)